MPNESPRADLVAELKATARRLGRDGFIKRFPSGFLLRRPQVTEGESNRSKNPFDDEDDDDDAVQHTQRIGFRTSLVTHEALALDLLDDAGAIEADRWVIVPLEKRAGNPYPERLSIGRATNCDVVLRWPTVSKLHAHLHMAHGALSRVTDCQSANGTFLNGKPVGAAGSAARLGDKLRLGTLECELVNAGAVYVILAVL